jgi:hypothetical protein
MIKNLEVVGAFSAKKNFPEKIIFEFQTGKFANCAPEINISRNFARPISEIARLI